jgi:hypothetical protein
VDLTEALSAAALTMGSAPSEGLHTRTLLGALNSQAVAMHVECTFNQSLANSGCTGAHREGAAIDGFAACSVAIREVATLSHKIGDNAMEGTSLEGKELSRLAHPLLSGAESSEVLRGLGCFTAKEAKHQALSSGFPDLDIHEHLDVMDFFIALILPVCTPG